MAAAEYFLRIDGVDGESADAKHKGEIVLEAFSWHESNAGSVSIGGGAAAGRVHFDDLRCVARTSKASPRLLVACASGEHLKSALLTCRRTTGVKLEFLKIALTDVLVSSYAVAGAVDPPADEFALAFGKVEIEYTPQAPSGKVDPVVLAGWDVAQGNRL